MIDQEEIVENSYALRPLSPKVVRLATMVADTESGLAEVAEVVSSDPFLAGISIQVANSARYGGRTEVGTVTDAVSRLGAGTVLEFALREASKEAVHRDLPEYDLTAEDFWRHSYACSTAAEMIRRRHCRARVPAEAQTAALLHDIGKALLGNSISEDDVRLMRFGRELGTDSGRYIEREVLGVDHAEVGGLIAQHWQLPESVRLGITRHHDPEMHDDPIADLVHVADLVAAAALPLPGHPEKPSPSAEILERLSMNESDFEKVCDDLRTMIEQDGLG